MALIKCLECERKISAESRICPHCGWPVKTENMGGARVDLRYLICRVLDAIRKGEKLTHQECGISIEEYGSILEMINGRYATDIVIERGGIGQPVHLASIDTARITDEGLEYLKEHHRVK